MTHQPLNVLFVDDEPLVLRSIERVLRTRRVSWQVRFANTADEALQLLEAGPFDVIVSDLRMPGVDGAQLLREVRSRHPEVARLVLSGQAATSEGLEVMRVAHQCLAKPYDLATLRRMVEGLASARRRVSEAIFRAVSQISSLPSPTPVYQRLRSALSAGTLVEAAAAVETDPALTAKILQLNTSAVLGVEHELVTVADALPRLDADLRAAFDLGEEICRPLDEAASEACELRVWYEHSALVARVARAIAPVGMRDKAFVAGILHDVGYLVEAALPDDLHEEPLDHGQLGACLLELWGIDEELVAAVAGHHDASGASTPAALTATLYLAEYVVAESSQRCCAAARHPSAPPENAAELARARAILRDLTAER
ncbi:MAG: HDOD domain-containing protein [Kofleriaceae bacterium]